MLTERMRLIAECVEDACTAADIGCDHGYIAQYLIESERAQKVIATDVSALSLQKTQELAKNAGLEVAIETRVGNGLSVLFPGEADTVVIAGMGGYTIRDILMAGEAVARQARLLVLAPNRNVGELRRYLAENGFAIVEEKLARERERFYPVICAQNGMRWTEENEFDYEIGRRLVEAGDENLKAYLKKEIGAAKQILDAAGQKNAQQRLRRLEKRCERMKEVLECLQEPKK